MVNSRYYAEDNEIRKHMKKTTNWFQTFCYHVPGQAPKRFHPVEKFNVHAFLPVDRCGKDNNLT